MCYRAIKIIILSPFKISLSGPSMPPLGGIFSGQNCRRVDASEFENRPFWFRLAVRIARLMAPIQ